MPFHINHLTPVIFGEGVSLETGKRLKEHGITRVLCVYDKGIKATGIVDKVIYTIKDEGIAVVEFDDVLTDPPIEMVDQAGELARNENVDSILGIGGGSTLDTAKGINVLTGNPGSIKDYLGMGIPQKPGKGMFAIPTTSGTGSEVTAVSVISNSEVGLKQGVVDPNCRPRLAIVDPELTLGLPAGLTASTGMDAFSHAIEAYTSAMNNPMSDILALEAVSLVVKYLPVAVADGSNLKARVKMSFASMIAGMSFNDSAPHLGHAIAHTMGAKFHVPHGVGCGLAAPSVLEYLSDVFPHRIRDIGKAMGLDLKDDLSSEELGVTTADAVRKLNKEIGLPSMSDLGFSEEDLPGIAEEAPRDGCWFLIPKQTGVEEVLKLIQKEYTL
jgi:alcohol dehydrogenase class IV